MKSEILGENKQYSPTPFISSYSNRPRPLAMRLLVGAVNALGYVAPMQATKIVVKLFLTPHRRVSKDLELAQPCQMQYINFNQKQIRLVTSGSGPKILLVHGWASGSYRFSAIADLLLSNGFSIIAVDLPAHGKSEGKQTNLRESAELIDHIVERFGPLRGIIAHSFGGSATLFNPKDPEHVERVVTIGSPTTTSSWFDPFFDFTGFSSKLYSHFTTYISEIAEKPLEEMSYTYEGYNFDPPLLICHDQEDETVDPNDALLLHQNLPNSTYYPTSSLGHSSILYDEDVLAKIVEFLS